MKFSPNSFPWKSVDSGFIEMSNVSIDFEEPSMIDMHFKIYYKKQEIKYNDTN